MQRFQFVESILRDLRYAIRHLLRSPASTVVIILCLGLSIGANTAVFSLLNAVTLKPLPVQKPDELVVLNWSAENLPSGITLSGRLDPDGTGRQISPSFSYPAFKLFEARKDIFSTLFGFAPVGFADVAAQGASANSIAEVQMVTGNYFSALGLHVALGRPLIEQDEKEGAEGAAVISYSYWTQAFGNQSSVLGRALYLNGTSYVIVGVAPVKFVGLDAARPADIWIPLSDHTGLLPWGISSAPRGRSLFTAEDWWWLVIAGRMQASMPKQNAISSLTEYFHQEISHATNQSISSKDNPQIHLATGSKGLNKLRNEFMRPLLILLSAVVLVLLVGCANVATLLLSSAVKRSREIAVRTSLGASRLCLVRQLFMESLLLALLAGGASLLIAKAGIDALLHLMSTHAKPISLDTSLDVRVLGFTAVISLLTGTLFGLAPVLYSIKNDLAAVLQRGSKGAGGHRTRVGRTMVIFQVAFSLVLLNLATVFVRTLNNLEYQDLGFDRTSILLFRVAPIRHGYEAGRMLSVYTQLLDRLTSLPGVISATLSQNSLLSGIRNNWPIAVEGDTSSPDRQERSWWNSVGPNFFETMKIPILLGRAIDARDTTISPRVAVVNEVMAHHFFATSNPVGRHFRFLRGSEPHQDYEIVGVARDAKYDDIREKAPPTIYISYLQNPAVLGYVHFEMRTAGRPTALIPEIRDVLRDVDPLLSVSEVMTQAEQIDESLMQERLFAAGTCFFAGLALLLACLGLYGLLAYSVASQTREIGIRMALGAQPKSILSMILRQSLAWVLWGLLMGIPITMATARMIRNQLYGLEGTDIKSLALAILPLLVITFVATYFPIRRALSVDPVVSLRFE
jgi:predicted permease